MVEPFWLSDGQWAAVEAVMPRNQPGPRRIDDRRIMSGILYVLTTKCRWKDCLPIYGPAATVYTRFSRWSRKPFWPKLVHALVETGVLRESKDVDSAYFRAQPFAERKRRIWSRRRTGRASRLDNVLAGAVAQTTVITGPTSTAFFIFMGEAVSVQVSVPSLPRSAEVDATGREARLNAAHALLTAATVLLDEL